VNDIQKLQAWREIDRIVKSTHPQFGLCSAIDYRLTDAPKVAIVFCWSFRWTIRVDGDPTKKSRKQETLKHRF
jgi:hypothetical protein